MRLRKRLAELEARVAALEEPDDKPEQYKLPGATIPTLDLDADRMWRDHVADFAHGWDDDEWSGYL